MSDERFEDETMEPLLRSKTYDESDMDITPMIDITFLLLIFFIVASKMDAAADVSLPPARYGMPVVEKSSVIVTLGAGEDGKAVVYKGNGANSDNMVPATDLEAQEDEIAGYVEAEMAQDNTKTNVLIKAAKGIKHREVNRICEAATRSENVQKLYVAVMEVQ